jgi:hypothetical protein
VRAAEGFSQKLITVVGKPLAGSLPPRQSFVSVEPKHLQVLAFRKKEGPGFEIRTVDVEGKHGPASVNVEMPNTGACETNLLGKEIGPAATCPQGEAIVAVTAVCQRGAGFREDIPIGWQGSRMPQHP